MCCSSAFLDQLGQGFAGAVPQGVQAHVASSARREVRIGFPQRPDPGVAALLADFAVSITAAVIKSSVAVLLAHGVLRVGSELPCDHRIFPSSLTPCLTRE